MVVRLYLLKKKEGYKPKPKKDELVEENKPVVGTVYVLVAPVK
jgi:hypothetical protein